MLAKERTNEFRPKSQQRRKFLLFHSWRCPLALLAVPPWWNHLADTQLRPGKGGSSSQCILTFCWQDTGEPLGEPAWGWSFDLAKHWSCRKKSGTFLFWPGQKEVVMETLFGNNSAANSVRVTENPQHGVSEPVLRGKPTTTGKWGWN